MGQNVFEHLGTEYVMLWHPGLPLSAFTPVQSLENCVETCNHLLDLHGTNILSWDPQHHDIMAQLMNANWICNRLDTEPIKKPILVHGQHGKLIVDCGDTRIMSLTAISNPPCLSAITTVRKTLLSQYQTWTPVQDTNHLIKLCGFDPNQTNVLFTAAEPDLDWAISWLEIGDQSTSHHLHDIGIRIQMLQQWLNTQSPKFRFSTQWVKESIDWASLAAKDQNL